LKDQIRGKAEEIKGKLTGDRGLVLKGKARQSAGDVKSMARDIRADVGREVSKHRKTAKGSAGA
jgi:uncharacterized protein YjbJ (UPF0337 family)